MSALSDALPFDKMRFFRLYTGISELRPRDRFFSVRMEESPQIITLNHILIAADFPAQLRTFPRSSVFSRSNSAARSFLWTDLGHSSFTSQVSLGKALLLQFNSSWIAKLAKR